MTAKIDRLHTFACVSLIAAIYAVYAGRLLIDNGFYIDDRLYLYTINFLVCEPARWNEASESLLAFLEHNSYSAEDVSIFQFRKEYSGNYLVHAVATCMSRVLLPQRLLDIDYGTWIYAIVQTGIGLSHLLAIGIVLWAVWSSRGAKIPYTVLLAFGILALLTIDSPGRNRRLTDVPSVIDFLFQSTIFTVSPGFEFDVFGITPRNDATLLLVAITVLRWQGRIAISYWVVVLMALVHGTYGALMLIVLLGIDVLLQPVVLRHWRCFMPVALVAAITVLRVQSFEAFGGTPIQLAALAMACMAFGGLLSSQGMRLISAIPFVVWLRGRRMVHAETLLYVIGMGASIVVAFLVASISTGLTDKYVAHELSGRPIGLLRIPALLGVCAMVSSIEFNGTTRPWRAVAVAVSVLALVSGLNHPKNIYRSWITAEEMETTIRTSMSEVESRLSRLQLYYVLSCSVDWKCPYLHELANRTRTR